MDEQTLVAIFGTDGLFRVKELPPGHLDATTVKVCHFYDDAEDFVNEHYAEEQMRTPDAFRAEVQARKGGV